MPEANSSLGKLVRRLTWIAVVCTGLWVLGSLMLATDSGRGWMGWPRMQVDSVQVLYLGFQALFWASVITWGGVVGGLIVLANRADQASRDVAPPGKDSYA